jgi:hypothetical protein
VLGEIEVRLLIRKRAERNRQHRPEPAQLGKRLGRHARRRNRAGRELVFRVVLENDVLVAVVLFRGQRDLRPLEACEGHQVGLGVLLGHRVALADRILAHLPGTRIERLGVIGQRIEVEL